MSTKNYDAYGPEVAALLRAAHAEKDAALRAAERIRRINTGSFYAKTWQVWGEETAELTASCERWNLFDRTGNLFDWECLGMSKVRKLAKIYKNTRDHALTKRLALVGSKRSRSSTSAATKKAIWTTDVVGNAAIVTAEGAHLLPAGQEIDHVEWFQVAAAAVGIEKSATLHTKLKAMRGCKNGSKRFIHEGVLHFVSNRILMQAQKYALDGKRPSMMIIPVLDHEAIRNWTGTGYEAIVLVGNPLTETLLEDAFSDDEIHAMYKSCGFLEELPRARLDQVNQARTILRVGVLALAEMIQALTDQDLKHVEGESKDGSRNLRTARTSLQARDNKVHVPKDIPVHDPHVHVATVRFVGHGDTDGGHPAPDPFLLLMKAANIWGCLTGMRLLANASLPNFDSEEDVRAQELYLELLESRDRNCSREELARSLGQLSS